MEAKQLRKEIHKRGWWYAQARNDGPTHIVAEHGRVSAALCGAIVDNSLHGLNSELCKKCVPEAERLLNNG